VDPVRVGGQSTKTSRYSSARCCPVSTSRSFLAEDESASWAYSPISVLAAGGQAFGVIPRDLLEKEIAHTRLTHLHVVDSMHERKALMASLADAFVLLPGGGYGSWEEFCEVITWAQLGIHGKPCGVLSVAGYYDPLLSLTSVAVTEGFIRPAHREMMIVEAAPDALLSRLAAAPHISEVKRTGEKQ
jgi:uncharacterized protein (TIGR00730 family)